MAVMSTPATTPAPWHLISLRPRGEHGALRAATARHGGHLVAASPWYIQRECGQSASQALLAALAAPVVIFTSPAAVNAANGLIPLRRPHTACWMSVGAGTAAMLHHYGVDQVHVPARMDSEGLLALPELARQLPGEVGLVTAPGGRMTLSETLTHRGARLLRADVYRRVPLTLRAATLARLSRVADRCVLAVSSGEALQVVLRQLPSELATAWRVQPVVAASERLLQLVREHGYSRVYRAPGPLPGQLAATAASIMTSRTLD